MFNLRNRLMAAVIAVIAVFALVFGVAAQDGMFGLSQEDFDAWSQANGISAMSTSSLGYDFTTTAQLVIEGDTVDMNLTGNGYIGEAGFTMNVSGTLSNGDEEIPAQLDIIVLEESFYFNIGSGWVAATPEDLEGASDLVGVPSETLTDPTSALPMETLGGLMAVDPTQYIVMSRDGQTFRIDLLLEDLLADPAVQEALMADPDTASVAMMAPMFLSGSEIFVTQTVGDSGMVDSANVVIAAGSAEMGFNVNFDFGINLDYASMQEITAPAETISFEEFLGQFGLGGM
jgi:hypothetical protein